MRSLLVVLGACGTATSPTRPPTPEEHRPAPPRQPAARHTVGALATPADGTQLFPSTVCIDGGELVFEHACGCNDRLLCTLVSRANGELAYTLRKDPTRMPMCDDCFPMEPARCELPTGAWTVRVNGQAAFALVPGDGSCWTAQP